MLVDIQDLIQINKILNLINEQKFEDIIWTDNGKPIDAKGVCDVVGFNSQGENTDFLWSYLISKV